MNKMPSMQSKEGADQEKELSDMFAAADTDKDQKVSIDEFRDWVSLWASDQTTVFFFVVFSQKCRGQKLGRGKLRCTTLSD